MAEASSRELEHHKRDHPPGSRVTGIVTHVAHVAPYGAYVGLGVPFAALLLVPYMAPPEKRKSFPEDYPRVGDRITAFVRLHADEDAQHGFGKIGLTQDPNAARLADAR